MTIPETIPPLTIDLRRISDRDLAALWKKHPWCYVPLGTKVIRNRSDGESAVYTMARV